MHFYINPEIFMLFVKYSCEPVCKLVPGGKVQRNWRDQHIHSQLCWCHLLTGHLRWSLMTCPSRQKNTLRPFWSVNLPFDCSYTVSLAVECNDIKHFLKRIFLLKLIVIYFFSIIKCHSIVLMNYSIKKNPWIILNYASNPLHLFTLWHAWHFKILLK